MEFGPQDTCKRRGLNTTRRMGEILFIFHFLQDVEKKKTFSAAVSHYWEDKTKTKKTKTNQQQKTAPHHTPKKHGRSEKAMSIQDLLKHPFLQRGLAFSQACRQDLVSLANSNIWGMTVNKSIFKCMILKQKNVSLLC